MKGRRPLNPGCAFLMICLVILLGCSIIGGVWALSIYFIFRL